ncbi:MAG: hypothetical protein ACI4DV_07660 [Lachnospiraceae bacterium]
MYYGDDYDFSRPYMIDDEHILWKGRPESGNLFTGSEVVLIPFGLIWVWKNAVSMMDR